jgi:hypothetical protein
MPASAAARKRKGEMPANPMKVPMSGPTKQDCPCRKRNK